MSFVPNLDNLLPAIELSAMRAQGAGGQNVNKVSSAIHLRFDVQNASLPQYIKDKLLSGSDKRVTQDGILIIKAQSFRTQEQNKADAHERLLDIIKQAGIRLAARRPTKPTRASQKRRVEGKKKQGQLKSLRKKVSY